MDLIGWLLRLVFFLLVLWFALQNTVSVTLHIPTHGDTQVPLVVVILVCFVAGAVAGVVALAPLLFRQRRRIAALTRAARDQHPSGSAPAPEGIPDVARRVGAVGGLETTEVRVRRR
ncbi:MAG: LapA family protein [Burkholderiaceae bacterium]|nr:LapA family protein [Burkholderiaceae bacterium]